FLTQLIRLAVHAIHEEVLPIHPRRLDDKAALKGNFLLILLDGVHLQPTHAGVGVLQEELNACRSAAKVYQATRNNFTPLEQRRSRKILQRSLLNPTNNVKRSDSHIASWWYYRPDAESLNR